MAYCRQKEGKTLAKFLFYRPGHMTSLCQRSKSCKAKKLSYPGGGHFQVKRRQNSREIFILPFWPHDQLFPAFDALQGHLPWFLRFGLAGTEASLAGPEKVSLFCAKRPTKRHSLERLPPVISSRREGGIGRHENNTQKPWEYVAVRDV